MLKSIEYSTRTKCGYATVKDVRDHALEDRMESFFLAETTKYLYLLFDTDNFIHNSGNTATVLNTPYGECIVDAGGYVFNTEAHPIDPAALQCCSGHTEADIRQFVTQHLVDIAIGDASPLNALFEEEFKGDTLPTRMKQIQQQRAEEEARRRRDRLKYEKKMEEEREKEREILKKRIAAEQAKKERSIKHTATENVPLGNKNSKIDPGKTGGHERLNEAVNSTKKINEQMNDGSSENSVDNSRLKDDRSGINDMPIVQNNAINKLDLEIKYEAPTDAKDDSTKDEPNFASNKNSESIVSDASDNMQPNILMKRQSKDFATTTIETKGQLEEKPIHKSTAADDNVDISNESPISGSLKVDKSKIEDDKPNSISEQTNITPSKSVQIDAMYFLNKFNSLVKEYLGGSKSLVGSSEYEFDLDEFRGRVMSDKRFELNKTWHDDYFIMSCPAKSFLERFSVHGEFF